ncbi:MAG TPA: SDR family oxidoreductase [Patescibacteria group bacterium]|nr:SDR family oxidoreductase [Patescibacteria group bacterium]
MKQPFHKQTVIISGGLGDIGRALAWEFGSLGASIALGDLRDSATMKPWLKKMTRQRIRWHYTKLDVSQYEAVCSWVQTVEKEIGLPDIIIPNAATVTLASIHQLTAEQWARELRVNLDGAFHLAKAATERLVARRQPGKVLFIGSWAADHVHTHIPVYCVSKAGLRMLCRCLALELASNGILVNELAPGTVNAGLSRQVQDQNPKLREQVLTKIPLKKLISPQEVAWQAAHLCHPDNKNMTGSTVVMDGGNSLIG